MKPINPYLGASPLRSSRIGYIDVQGKSWDSVVFQQSKSILDFDLNVMQRILQESIAQLTRSLFISGFTSNTTITTAGTNVLLPDSKVNFFGTTARIADPSGAEQKITIDCSGWTNTSVSNQVFLWLELWFQEVAPALVSEPFDGLSSLENKLSTVYQYGNDPITGGTILTNELKDTGFGAETTRRIQVRWRIRQTPGITSTTTYPKGFVNSDASASNSIVWAQGGRKSCVITGYTSNNTLTVTSVTSGYLMNNMKITGNGFTTATITSSPSGNQTGTYTFDGNAQSVGTSGTPVTFYGWFTIEKNFSRADKTSGNDFSKDGDTNVYIAGDGTTADALLLNTVDGRVYGLPIGFYYAGSPNGVFTDARNVVTGVNTGSLVGTGASFSGTGVGTSGLVINVGGPNPQITTSSSNTNTNLVIDPGGDGSLQVNGSILSPSISPNNAAGAPAYSFQSYTNSGLYYDSSNGVAVSQNGSNVAYFSAANGLTVNGIVTGTALRANGTTLWGTNVASGRYLGTVSSSDPTSTTGANWQSGDYVFDLSGSIRMAVPITATATFTSGSTSITINGTISPATGAFIVGAPISGTGIPTNTYITAVAAGGGLGSYTISQATTSAQTTTDVSSVYWTFAGVNPYEPVTSAGLILNNVSSTPSSPGANKFQIYSKNDSSGIPQLYYIAGATGSEVALTSSQPGFSYGDEGLYLTSGGIGGGGGSISLTSNNTWTGQQTFAGNFNLSSPAYFNDITVPSAPSSGVILYSYNGALYYKSATASNLIGGGSGAATGVQNTFTALQTLSAGLQLSTGAISAPSLYFSNSSASGQYSPAANVLAWTIGGNATFQLSSSGAGFSTSVGIGTTSPSAPLHINTNISTGTVTNSYGLRMEPTFTANAATTITNAIGLNANSATGSTGSITNLYHAYIGGNSYSVKPTTAYGAYIANVGSNSVTTSYGLYVDAQSSSTNAYSAVFNGGNVGVGTTSPSAPLHINTSLSTYGTGGTRLVELNGSFTGASNDIAAMRIGTALSPSGAITNSYGLRVEPTFTAAASTAITYAIGLNANSATGSTGSITNLYHAYIGGNSYSVKPTTAYGAYIANVGSASVTTSYGLYVDTQSSSTTAYSAIFNGGNVGVGTNAPTSTFTVNGTFGVLTGSSGTNNSVILTNVSYALPTAVGAHGRIIWVKNTGSSAISLTSAGGTIDGVSSISLSQYDSYTVVSDNSNWYII